MANVHISHPKKNTPITTTFFATGRAGKKVTDVDGELEDQHGRKIQGKTVRRPQCHKPWQILFKDVPASDANGPLTYTLRVTALPAGGTDKVTQLTIKARQRGQIYFPDNDTEHSRFDFISYGDSSVPFDHGEMNDTRDDDHFWDGEYWCAQWYQLPVGMYDLEVYAVNIPGAFDSRTGLNLS